MSMKNKTPLWGSVWPHVMLLLWKVQWTNSWNDLWRFECLMPLCCMLVVAVFCIMHHSEDWCQPAVAYFSRHRTPLQKNTPIMVPLNCSWSCLQSSILDPKISILTKSRDFTNCAVNLENFCHIWYPLSSFISGVAGVTVPLPTWSFKQGFEAFMTEFWTSMWI